MSALLDALRNPSITNQPPTVAEQRRNDRYTIGLIILAVLIGWLLRNSAVNAVQQISFENEIPTISIPANWITERRDEQFFSAYNPASTSTFDTRVEVYARPLREGEDLSLLNVSWPLERSQQLDRFRTLSSTAVTSLNNEPAVLLTYAYIADPTRESGAMGLPVVVRGQDLLYLTGAEDNRQLVVVTTVADAVEWEESSSAFQRIHNQLGVEVRE